jgi:hypothetical protein
MRAGLLACALLLGAPLVAQEAPAPLTEVERLRVENITLKSQLLQIQLDAFQAERAKLVQDIEAPRVGWTWDLATGKFEKKTRP